MKSAFRVLLLGVMALPWAGPLAAQTTEEREQGMEEQPAPSGGPVRGTRPRSASRQAAASRPAGVLGATRAVRLRDGEATLRLQGEERVLRPGDRLGSDVVKSVSEGRIVLHRPAEADPKAGGTLVIVEFDAEGRPRTRMFSMKDTKPVPAGPAR